MQSGAQPTPRSRNAAFTRAAILQAACSRFAREGYDGASLRDLASDAGVDPALICRYFGSKEDLFTEALASCGPPEDLFDGGPAEFCAKVADILVFEPWNAPKFDHMLMMLRSVSSPRAAEIVRASTRQSVYNPLEAWLGGGPDAAVRARALAGIAMGMTVSRAIEPELLLDETQRQALRDRLVKILEAAIA